MNRDASQLMEKLNEEYESYLNDLLKHDVQYAVSRSLDTVIRQNIMDFFSKSDYLAFQQEEWIDAMLEAENLLDEIQKTMKSDGIFSGLLHLADVIQETGNRLKEQKGR